MTIDPSKVGVSVNPTQRVRLSEHSVHDGGDGRPSVSTDNNSRPRGVDITPTLIQNDCQQYVFVPRHLANELVKEHKAHIMRPADPDYVEGTKRAMGRADGFAPGGMIQVKGQAKTPEQLGVFDVEGTIERAKTEAEKYAQGKKEGALPYSQKPEDPTTFEGKKENFRWG